MSFLIDYLLFFAKALTLCLGVVFVFASILALVAKAKRLPTDRLSVRKLNDSYAAFKDTLHGALLSKKQKKQQRKADKQAEKSADDHLPRLFVIRFEGDMKASAVSALREEITAILLVATPEDEVLCVLSSPGGLVNAYGLAASQLARLREASLQLTVVVDQVAASGGYMMAAVANRILAAPFAIIGSIGVVAQIPNFHRYLKSKAIDFEQLTAGQYKRTLTMFGDNKPADREKMQADLEATHDLFKDFIQQYRPTLNLEQVATGEYWYGQHALALGLIDGIQTSDDFCLSKQTTHRLYAVRYAIKKPLLKRCGQAAQSMLVKLGLVSLSELDH
jgi:serine protease SohB